jgi:hypothetical protein
MFYRKRFFAKKIKKQEHFVPFVFNHSELRLRVFDIKTHTIKNDLSLSSSKKIENI